MHLEEYKGTLGCVFFLFFEGVGEQVAKEKINLLRMTHKSFSF